MDSQDKQTGFILGAGFSMAVSKSMPNMKMLFKGIIEILYMHHQEKSTQLADRIEKFSNMDLESVLTYLSTAEPWLSESDILRNRADFLEISSAIGEYIRKSEREIPADRKNSWARCFIKNCKERRVTMVSMNYDLIIENYVGEQYANYYPVNFSPIEINNDDTFSSIDAMVTAKWPRANTPFVRSQFRFHKLHGSLNWYYSGENSDIYDAGLKDIILRHDDKIPLIIPPTFSKSTYFQNPKLKAIWRSSCFWLEQCEEIYVVGYSMPSSDVSMKMMLRRVFE